MSYNHLQKKCSNRLNITLEQFGYISLNAIVNGQLKHHRKFTILNLKKETKLRKMKHMNSSEKPLKQQFIDMLEKKNNKKKLSNK